MHDGSQNSPVTERVIAITGSTGLIGRRLVALLGGTGVHLRLLARTPSAPLPDTTFIHGDLTDERSLQELVTGADCVVHLGGIAHSSLTTPEEQAEAQAINVGGTQKLLDACLRQGVGRFLLVSTAHVYACQAEIGLREDSPVSGRTLYAAMKLEAEAATRHAAQNGLHAIILRPCIVYGPGARVNLESLMRAVRKGYYFHAGGVDPLRSFASVDTVAAAIVHLLDAGESGASYNVADREAVHLVEWVNDLARRMGVKKPRTLPLGLLQSVAAMLTPASKLGLHIPLTREALAKLTASFSLDVTALQQTGFQWPNTCGAVLDEMIQYDLNR